MHTAPVRYIVARRAYVSPLPKEQVESPMHRTAMLGSSTIDCHVFPFTSDLAHISLCVSSNAISIESYSGPIEVGIFSTSFQVPPWSSSSREESLEVLYGRAIITKVQRTVNT